MSSLYRTFDALDPSDPTAVQTRQVGVEKQQFDKLLSEEHQVRLARLALAKHVCSEPDWIFEGLQRPEQDWSTCYVGSPGVDFRGLKIQTPPPPGTVFLVFVTTRGKIWDWRWEDVDKDGTGFPENYRTRFGRILWPSQQIFSPNGPTEILAAENSVHTPTMVPKKMR